MRIAVHTFGCKLNQAESQEIIKKLIQQNYQIVPIKEKANYYLINSCAVTAKAEKEFRQLINQIKRREPKSFLIVTGCYLPQQNKKVDLWGKREELFNKIKKINTTMLHSVRVKNNEVNRISKNFPNTADTRIINSITSLRTRSFIKIQDGCDKFCTYCLVPYLRGKPKSKPIKKIIQEIREKERQGYQEVVLVGVDIGQYQSDGNLVHLVREILNKTNIPRLRLSSLWPTTITSELIDLFQNPRLCPHLHLSIQSGSNKILRLMGRNYTKQDIGKIIKMARRKIPNLNLTADIIVGFPGESEKEFQATYKFIKSIGFSKIHIFKYSARPLTAASRFPCQVPKLIQKKRSQKLIKLGSQLNRKIRQKFIGHQLPVLFEQPKNGYWTGLTNNYLRVYTKSRENLSNQIRRVRLEKIWQDGLNGTLVD